MADLTVKVDVKDILDQVEEIQRMFKHYQALDILITYIKMYMPEPHKTKCLDAWDSARK